MRVISALFFALVASVSAECLGNYASFAITRDKKGVAKTVKRNTKKGVTKIKKKDVHEIKLTNDCIGVSTKLTFVYNAKKAATCTVKSGATGASETVTFGASTKKERDMVQVDFAAGFDEFVSVECATGTFKLFNVLVTDAAAAEPCIFVNNGDSKDTFSFSAPACSRAGMYSMTLNYKIKKPAEVTVTSDGWGGSSTSVSLAKKTTSATVDVYLRAAGSSTVEIKLDSGKFRMSSVFSYPSEALLRSTEGPTAMPTAMPTAGTTATTTTPAPITPFSLANIAVTTAQTLTPAQISGFQTLACQQSALAFGVTAAGLTCTATTSAGRRLLDVQFIDILCKDTSCANVLVTATMTDTAANGVKDNAVGALLPAVTTSVGTVTVTTTPAAVTTTPAAGSGNTFCSAIPACDSEREGYSLAPESICCGPNALVANPPLACCPAVTSQPTALRDLVSVSPTKSTLSPTRGPTARKNRYCYLNEYCQTATSKPAGEACFLYPNTNFCTQASSKNAFCCPNNQGAYDPCCSTSAPSVATMTPTTTSPTHPTTFSPTVATSSPSKAAPVDSMCQFVNFTPLQGSSCAAKGTSTAADFADIDGSTICCPYQVSGTLITEENTRRSNQCCPCFTNTEPGQPTCGAATWVGRSTKPF